MSDFQQMELDDVFDLSGRLESEQKLAALAWAIVRRGSLTSLSMAESELVDMAGEAPASIISDIANAIEQGGDPLGDAFERLRSARQRRPMGAVYTPPGIVDAMVGWVSSKEQPARIIDPGSGSGRFALRAGRTFPDASLVAVEVERNRSQAIPLGKPGSPTQTIRTGCRRVGNSSSNGHPAGRNRPSHAVQTAGSSSQVLSQGSGHD